MELLPSILKLSFTTPCHMLFTCNWIERFNKEIPKTSACVHFYKQYKDKILFGVVQHRIVDNTVVLIDISLKCAIV